jgi:beta-1,4-mannosyl-glycoprotein beta-1,4-N-acetylglucosaminyltransferase
MRILENIVDHFVIIQARQTFTGKPKQIYYNEINPKVVNLVIDLPYTNPTPEQVWENERYQRNYIEKGLLQLNLNETDLIIISDVDEIPDPRTLNDPRTLEIIQDIAQLEQGFYYYTVEHSMDHNWYFSKILQWGYYINTDLTFSDIRHNSYFTIPKGGWHLSYFGSAEFISNKIQSFSHQEYNTPEFTNVDLIKNRISNCVDIYDRPIKIVKVPADENKYFPIGFYNKTIFIHSCNLDNCKKLDYLMDYIKPFGYNVKIFNIGPRITKKYRADIIQLSDNPKDYEIPTLNKIWEYSQNVNEEIIYIHTKGITSDSSSVRDWIDMMLYFIFNHPTLGTFDIAGCNFTYNPRYHFSGNFWMAKTNYIRTLKPIDPKECFMEAEFWIFTGKPKAKVLYNSGIDHYLEHFPKERYLKN